jgi:hypothetical protein
MVSTSYRPMGNEYTKGAVRSCDRQGNLTYLFAVHSTAIKGARRTRRLHKEHEIYEISTVVSVAAGNLLGSFDW